MNITIICIGKLKERYWTEAAAEYCKRLGKYCKMTIEELKEARLPDRASSAEEQAVKLEEGQSILSRIKKNDYVITLEIDGKPLTSEKLSQKLGQLSAEGWGRVVFVIGAGPFP